MKTIIPRSNVYFYFLLFILTLFFVMFIGNSHPESLGIRFYADSDKYIDLAKSQFALKISPAQNLFGPVLLFRILGNNYYVFIINLVLMIYFYNNLSKFVYYKRYLFLLIFINPMIYLSLFYVNKEIFGLVSTILILKYIEDKKLKFFILSCGFALLTRWQHLFVNVIFLLFIHTKLLNKNKILKIIIVLICASFAYSALLRFIPGKALSGQYEKLFGIVGILNKMQDNYLYFLAYFFKLALNIFGNLFRIFSLQSNTGDFYNKYIVLSQLYANLILVLLILLKDIKSIFNYDCTFYFFIYTIVFCLSPIIQYRYFLPMYPIYIILALRRRENDKCLSH